MATSAPSSRSPSRAATPNPRFTSQASTAEDLLKEQTVGLVHLSDFRKRRAEALEQKEREAHDAATPAMSGASTPTGGEAAPKPLFKKKKKAVKKGALSFGDDEDGNGDGSAAVTPAATPRSNTPGIDTSATATDGEDGPEATALKKRLKPNSSVAFAPKAMTKSAVLREAQLKEQLRKDFVQMQEAVKQTEVILPFVFFDGSNVPGGRCRIKKGDFIWLFLERARKVGAEDKSRKDWARIGVDDLMLVRGDLIIPHHYELYYFIVNRTVGYQGPLFPYSSERTAATPKETGDSTPSTPSDLSLANTLSLPTKAPKKLAAPTFPDAELEGYADDPNATKVVDRRWYERSKHIYPMSIWEDFDPGRDYSKGGRKDGEGNAFFFSSR